MRAPKFWQHDGLTAHLLAPLSALWTWGADYRASQVEAFRPGPPIICVGNTVAGGAGKTPVVIALTEALQARGRRPHVLSRGFAGREPGPLRVDPVQHTALDVGDEALLLAAVAPAWISRWRPAGAAAATKGGAEVIVLDDGFQNHTLVKDLSVLVVDGAYGFGNGRVIPAGPCREPPNSAIGRADAVVILGADRHGVAALCPLVPVLGARLVPTEESADLAGRRVVAFAGIGRPEKFFRTLVLDIGADVVIEQPFADHHRFTASELTQLLDDAKDQDAILVTTSKDWVRLPPDLQTLVRAVPVRLVWDDEAQLDLLLDQVCSS